MKLNLLLSTCLKMVMSMIVGMKCNKYPGICKWNFLEILYINVLNTVKRVYNRYLRFLKKGLRKPGVPLDSIFALYRFDNYLLSANEVKIN